MSSLRQRISPAIPDQCKKIATIGMEVYRCRSHGCGCIYDRSTVHKTDICRTVPAWSVARSQAPA
jgi:hypothetical protein